MPAGRPGRRPAAAVGQSHAGDRSATSRRPGAAGDPAVLRRTNPQGPVRDDPARLGGPAGVHRAFLPQLRGRRPGRATLILFQNIGYTHAEWAFRDGNGKWAAKGKLVWPWGGGVRQAAADPRLLSRTSPLRGRAVHFCGVSDIVEPYAEVAGVQEEADRPAIGTTTSAGCSTPGRDDITTRQVPAVGRDRQPRQDLRLDHPGDLWLAPDGAVHLLWTERAIDERLREEFFPDEKQSHTLHYAVLREGKVVSRSTLLKAEEGGPREVPGRGRFHATPDGRLFAFFYVSRQRRRGTRPSRRTGSWNSGRTARAAPRSACRCSIR